jgi:predicted GIY-YIG superfamily endonuclease
MDPSRLVEEGYDRIAQAYAKGRAWFDNAGEVADLASLLPPGSRVLDAGCGAGVPITRDLVDRGFIVTGVDVSREMLALASANVPQARFFRADMSELHFDDHVFDGVVCSYALFHLPRGRHEQVFSTFHRILKDRGHLLVSLGTREWEETKDYLGAPMFWSHYSAARTVDLLKAAGFDVVWQRASSTGGEKHVWVLARKTPLEPRYSLAPPMPPPWQVYVLECDDGSYYTGVTNNLPNRMKLHSSGKGAKYTRMHPPKRVLLTLPAATRNEAQQIETWLKGRDHASKTRFVSEGAPRVMEKWAGYKASVDGEPAKATFLPKPPHLKKPKKKKPRKKKDRK